MKQRITLPTETIKILEQYGDIHTVVDNILDLVQTGAIPTDNLPQACASDTTVKKITVHITNDWYIESYLANNKICLKRLLQYFVDNELFNEFDWKPVNTSHKQDKVLLDLIHAMTYLLDASTRTVEHRTKILDIAFEIKNLHEVIKNERAIQN